jgi:hypothetical protein
VGFQEVRARSRVGIARTPGKKEQGYEADATAHDPSTGMAGRKKSANGPLGHYSLLHVPQTPLGAEAQLQRFINL